MQVWRTKYAFYTVLYNFNSILISEANGMLNFGRNMLTDYYCVIMEKLHWHQNHNYLVVWNPENTARNFSISKPNLLHSNAYASREQYQS